MVVQLPLFAIRSLEAEDSLRAAGYGAIAGIDEVGRGCWAGPVFAGAVILPAACYEDRALLAEVTDSKLLSPLKRERLSAAILDCATAAAIGWAEAPVVDQLNVLGATRLAMRAAIECLSRAMRRRGPGWGAMRLAGVQLQPDYLLIDAVKLLDVPLPQRSVIRGDSSCLAIAAASIVAKVQRDAHMRTLALRYTAYDLASNKGYGSRRHMEGLRRAGVSPLHRRSFAPVKYFLGLRDHVAGALPASLPQFARLGAPLPVPA
ncbi:MAG TPA: ribonuclease HII [Chloroflexota bacterium]|nr:ribonuclease HII [Chloroflexota bacterium]